jgi:hypothetical protein
VPPLSPDGFAVMVIEEDELMAAGVTESQLPPVVVVALVRNDTAPSGTLVEKVTVCETGVLDPAETAGGVQDVRLGVTVGGGVPVAMSVPSVMLKTEGDPPLRVYVNVPVTLFVSRMADGTAVFMAPLGMVTLAVTTASSTVQLLMLMVSAAPALSVRVTATGGVALHVRPPSAIPITLL